MAAFIAVTAAYWAFMLTDGALRMLVLLHFHTIGFSPVQLAYLFVFYEIAGIVTNFGAGWVAARFGLTSTLYAGLGLQVAALVALSLLDPAWPVYLSVVFVMAVQGFSGIAKDLAKMSSKSAVKLLAPKDGGTLFRWVALMTGSKNAVKGFGFLIGATFLALFGFKASVLGMAVVLFLILAALVIKMPKGLPSGRKDARISEVLSRDRNINWLSTARVFLFGARDVWFVVGIPIYFYSVLSDGTAEGNRQAFFLIGGFMAIWIIFYGVIQALAPRMLSGRDPVILAAPLAAALAFVPAILAATVFIATPGASWLTASVVAGLLLFGALFALNSSLHSFLILTFTSENRVTMDVGFYYMANAFGRLLGTVLSGASYQLGGLPACLGVASAMLLLSAVSAGRLRQVP